MTSDYRYDTEADCFVVEDEKGNELCRTRSPHRGTDKLIAKTMADAINTGLLIFPSPSDQQPQTHA